MSVKLLIELNCDFLSLTGDYTGSSESTLVKIPHCWKSHIAAQICRNKFEEGQYDPKTILEMFQQFGAYRKMKSTENDLGAKYNERVILSEH